MARAPAPLVVEEVLGVTEVIEPPALPVEATSTPLLPAENPEPTPTVAASSPSAAPTSTAAISAALAAPPAATSTAVPAATSTAAPATVPALASLAASTLTGMDGMVLAAHLEQRAAYGLSGLTVDATLTAVAQARAQDMVTKGYFSHVSPSGETAFTMLAARGYPVGVQGENVAQNSGKGAASVSTAMGGWLSSVSHRANILNPAFRRIGIGIVSVNGLNTFVVVFTD